jgi:hypothetical protein
MTPKIADIQTWQQAELLMQPAFIRLVDNIRKQLEQSNWQGSYQDIPQWAENVPVEVRETVAQLQAELKAAPPEQAAAIEAQLANLPSPHPGYVLCLKHNGHEVTVDLWDLCYQICFQNYRLDDHDDSQVAIDSSLLDETGEVDWHCLDQKTHQIVEQIFKNLPK